MLQSFIDTLFGCSHQHTTFPMTPGRRPTGFAASNAARKGTYVVCLDCGKEFAYDWKGMRVGEAMMAPVASRGAIRTEAQPQFR
jgi:hypothetical protein